MQARSRSWQETGVLKGYYGNSRLPQECQGTWPVLGQTLETQPVFSASPQSLLAVCASVTVAEAQGRERPGIFVRGAQALSLL